MNMERATNGLPVPNNTYARPQRYSYTHIPYLPSVPQVDELDDRTCSSPPPIIASANRGPSPLDGPGKVRDLAHKQTASGCREKRKIEQLGCNACVRALQVRVST